MKCDAKTPNKPGYLNYISDQNLSNSEDETNFCIRFFISTAKKEKHQNFFHNLSFNCELARNYIFGLCYIPQQQACYNLANIF